jgi:hypothetical protein
VNSIPEDVEMPVDIRVGDHVRLLGLPDWLTNDLPESEQEELRAFIGQSAVVSDIDSHGYFWLGFGGTTQVEDATRYSGHSFCIPREFIEPVVT